jgi:hypothetical protein
MKQIGNIYIIAAIAVVGKLSLMQIHFQYGHSN